MKKLLVLFAVLLTTPICAQITLEHNSSNNTFFYVDLMQVDSNEWKYIYTNKKDTIQIYSIQHQLEKTLIIPINSDNAVISYVSKHLFNTDDSYEYLLTGGFSQNTYTFIFNETGDTLFQCSGCYPNNQAAFYRLSAGGEIVHEANTITNLPTGTKMIIRYQNSRNEIYSLPGKLPTSNTKLSITDAPTIISSSSPSTSAYPNPSSGKIRVAYSLPEGITTGELVITTTDGREVKRYRVGNMFNDILIEKSELPSGAYFYKLITERGESEARKFIITQ